MTNLPQDMQVDLVLMNMKSGSQRHVFQSMCQEMCTYFIPSMPNSILDQLLEQERIASSGVGDGIAIPHLRMNYLSRPFLAFAKLATPVDFNAIDHKPVDLVCMLLSPKEDGPLHLQRLSRLTRLMKSHGFAEKLRSANDRDGVRSLFMAPEGWLLAA